MTYNTCRAIVNKVLIQLGDSPVPNDATYLKGVVDAQGNYPGGLPKPSAQAISLLDLFQQALAMTFNKPIMTRKFIFNTMALNAQGVGVADYVIKDANIEGFKCNSFWNVTNGSGPGNGLMVLPYEEYMRMYARPDFVPVGVPQWLIPLPYDGSDTCKVKLCPTPDQVYTIEGQARIVVPQIKAGSDLCAFPSRYEHGLIAKLVEAMEGKKNEGRESNARVYAEQFLAEIFRDASGAEEEQEIQDLGVRLYRGGWSNTTRDYNPATDTVTPYP